MLLLPSLFVFALLVTACGSDEPEGVVVPGEDNEVVAGEVATGGGEAGAATEGVVVQTTDQVDAVATTVVTETLVDTDVVTQVEVFTQTDTATVKVITEVMTDTDVVVDTASDTESTVMTSTQDVDSNQAFAVILITDAAGNQFLGDPLDQRPVFASQSGTPIADARFTPIEAGTETLLGAGLDQNRLGQLDQGGVRQLTYNDYPLYRFTGAQGEDWQSAAGELGLSPVTAEGEFGTFSE
jgi:hypothetical protein